MKLIFSLLLIPLIFFTHEAKASVIGGTPYHKVIYVAYGPTATQSPLNSGFDYGSPKGFYDGDLFDIPKNVYISNVYIVVDEAVSGLTAFNIGDDDAASGFIASSSPAGTLGTTGLQYWNVDYKGSYLKGGIIVTTGVLSKYYSAIGKELKLDVTGTALAGKIRIFVDGFATGASQ